MTLDHSVYGPEMRRLLDEFARTEVVAPAPNAGLKFMVGKRVRWNSKQGPQIGTLTMRWNEEHRWAVQLDQHPTGSVTILHERQMDVM